MGIKEILENIKIDLDRLITEEYGISNQIVSYTNDISKLLVNVIKKNKNDKKYNIDSNNVKSVTGTIKKLFYDKEILVRCTMYYFKTEEEYNRLCKLYNFEGSCRKISDKNNKQTDVIILNTVCVNGKIDNNTFGNTLQHELMHLHDMIVYNNKLLNRRKKQLYDKVIDCSRNGNTVEEKRLARCLYICFKHEQIGHINGLDNTIRSNQVMTINDVRCSLEYRYLVLLKYVIDHFPEYSNVGKDIFGIESDRLLNTLTNGYNCYCRRLGRVIYKHQKQLYGELGEDNSVFF